MNAFVVFLVLVGFTPTAVLGAMWATDALNRHFWRRYDYCPTRERLEIRDEGADA